LERLGLPSLASLPSLAPLLDADAELEDAADRVADAPETEEEDTDIPAASPDAPEG
jgi:hypothetical protein